MTRAPQSLDPDVLDCLQAAMDPEIGLSVVDLGVAKVTANGEVFNLKKLSDFSGNYVAGEAGAAVGGGAGAVTMKNQHGVVMKLTGTGTGVKFTLAGKGVDVKLKQ